MESLSRYRRHPSLDTQRAFPTALPAMPPPGLPAPGSASITAPFHSYPADGPTDLGYTYSQLLALDTTLQSVSTSASLGVTDAAAAQSTANTALANAATAQSTANSATTTANAALPKAGGTMTGNLIQNAAIGIGQTPVALHGLDYLTTDLRVSLTGDYASWQNNMGVVIDKTNKASTQSQCVVYGVGGKQCWAAGMDVATNTAGNGGTGNGDYVPVFDATAGWNDDGTRSVIGGGADIFRFTPSEEASGGKSTTWDLNGSAGANKNTTAVWGLMTAGKDLSGIKLSINGNNARSHLILEQRASTHVRAEISFNQRWLLAQDITATNAPSFTFFDNGSVAANKNRLWIEATNNEQARVGINTISPAGLLSVSGDNAAAHYEVPQVLFAAGYSNNVANRSISFQQLLNATVAKQYLWLNGGLGSASTVAAPVATSNFAYSWGLESADGTFAVVNAGPGANQAIVRPIQVDGGGNVHIGINGGNVGFMGVAPVGRVNITGSRGGNVALANLLTHLENTGLLANGTTA